MNFSFILSLLPPSISLFLSFSLSLLPPPPPTSLALTQRQDRAERKQCPSLTSRPPARQGTAPTSPLPGSIPGRVQAKLGSAVHWDSCPSPCWLPAPRCVLETPESRDGHLREEACCRRSNISN